uniref:Amino acid permease/ SLC12A domain-containing protein n=1 Tax=Fagus sylvatica TaxID=28930 RepID=A0A2N9IMF7_FAGSY
MAISRSAEEEFPGRIGARQYRPVIANDRAVLEMSSIDSGSSSSGSPSFSQVLSLSLKIKVGKQANMGANTREGSLPIHEQANGASGESRLELFGFDSLVNILGLKSMTGEQIPAPSSPRDGDDVPITAGRPRPADLKLGTMMGVFVPCLQSILGIIYYIRFSWCSGKTGKTVDHLILHCGFAYVMWSYVFGLFGVHWVMSHRVIDLLVVLEVLVYDLTWLHQGCVLIVGEDYYPGIVGMAGIGESLLLVSFCGLCTFLTGISLSAIATNGAMKGGGPYYLIGRALGPEVGVSIGLCFFLGNAVAGALYVLGAVETFLKAVPAAGIFRETIINVNVTSVERVESPSSHDLQIYGIVVTIVLCFIVFGGVKMINRVAPAFLIPVLFSLFCIFMGVFLARKDHPKSLSLETFKENWSPGYQNTNEAGVPDPEGSVYWNFKIFSALEFGGLLSLQIMYP